MKKLTPLQESGLRKIVSKLNESSAHVYLSKFKKSVRGKTLDSILSTLYSDISEMDGGLTPDIVNNLICDYIKSRIDSTSFK